MTAPLVDPSSADLARRADEAPRRAGGRQLGRRAVLVAILLGVVLGAMTCAAGLAGGTGHAAHAAVPPAAPDADHDIHGADHSAPDHQIDDSPSPVATDGDAPTVPPVPGHPGMACVAPIDLRILGPSVVTSSDVCALHRPSVLADGAGELDPPVPRCS